MDDTAIERLAMEEILNEAKRGAERAKELGAFGWQKSRIPPANKIFLRNLLVSTLQKSDSQNSKVQKPSCFSSSQKSPNEKEARKHQLEQHSARHDPQEESRSERGRHIKKGRTLPQLNKEKDREKLRKEKKKQKKKKSHL